MIPKNIIQIWLGGEDSNSTYLRHVSRSWQINNPDWAHKIYEDDEVEEIIANFSQDVLKIYHSPHSYTSKADIARLVLLHELGGLYLDMDMLCTGPIPEDTAKSILNSSFVSMSTAAHANNCLMASRKGGEEISSIIEFALQKHNADIEALRWPNFLGIFGPPMLHSYLSTTFQSEVEKFLSSENKSIDHLILCSNGIAEFEPADFYHHLGSAFLNDISDTRSERDIFDDLATLYRGLPVTNGDIRIESKGMR